MISVKKALFAACFGLGLGVSLTAMAAPTRATCEALADGCRAGDAFSCERFYILPCQDLYGIEI